jgi:putative ABC transport system permease protein
VIRLAPLNRKLLRDLKRLWLQIIAVGAVLGCGIALYVMATGMFASLERARDAYYASARMADVAVSVVRAPERLTKTLEALPGVDAVETRVSGIGLVDLPGVTEPVSARLLSLPVDRPLRVNDVVLREGRLPSPLRDTEIVVNEAFAQANSLQPGARLTALIYGKRRELEVVGIGSSPEFVFAVAPGELLPEPKRFGVFWMGREALARAFDLDGAFNDVVARLAHNADERAVVDAFDAVLARHGGRGAYGRDRMLSAQFLQDELRSLRTMAQLLPPFFLLVAVFLVNISLSRLVATERANIGLLKAFGYRNVDIALHYGKFSIVFALMGAVVGLAVGTWGGRYMADVFRSVYHLPVLDFTAGPTIYAGAMAVGLVAALIGAAQAVRNAVALPPAAALAPPAPTSFGRLGGRAERAARRLDAKSRMIVRRIVRFPRRALTTVLGLAFALALLVTSRHFPEVTYRIVEVHFAIAQRMDVNVAFAEVADERILRDLAHLPGVQRVEPLRSTSVILSAGARRQRDAVLGVPVGAELNRIVDISLNILQPRADGITLSTVLARKLGVAVGDDVLLQATDGRRRAATVPVVAIVKPYVGAPAYMEIEALGRLLGEPERVTSAFLQLDARERDRFSAAVKELPAIAGVTFADNAEASLIQLFTQGTGFFSAMFILFSSLMAAGVAFSAARVTLAEQERDLATLRVLGFRRREASYVLLGEIGALLLVALPTGMILGALMTRWLLSQFEHELFTFPEVVDLPAYGWSIIIVTAAVALASFAVRRGVDRLDLVGVLKSRD